MTSIKIYRKNNKISKFEIKGHSGYEIEGKDIVCAAISSIAQTAALGVMRYVGINAECKAEEAQFYFGLPECIDDNSMVKVEAILETMLMGLKEVSHGYKKYVSLLELEV